MANLNLYKQSLKSSTISTVLDEQNSTFNALLINFFSDNQTTIADGFPTSANLSIDGVSVAVKEGMLYRSGDTQALFTVDVSGKKNSGSSIPGYWTRNGIGVRVFDNNTERDSDLTVFEDGELVVSLNGTSPRLYIASVANENSNATFFAVGTDPSYQVSGNDISIIGTTLTIPSLQGDVVFNNNLYVSDYIYHKDDSNTYVRFVDDVINFVTGGSEKFRIGSNYITLSGNTIVTADSVKFNTNKVLSFGGSNEATVTYNSTSLVTDIIGDYYLDLNSGGYVYFRDGNSSDDTRFAFNLDNGNFNLDGNLYLANTKFIQFGDGTQLSSATMLGVGQTWQNVLSSRAGSVSYQNITTRPIMVAVSDNYGGNPRFQVSTDNINWVDIGLVGSYGEHSFSFIVPVNHYYRVNGAITPTIWSELR